MAIVLMLFIMLYCVEMEDYIMQNTDFTFPPGTLPGDRQCLGIAILDNNRADGNRQFSVNLVSFDPLVRVVENLSRKAILIVDNDGNCLYHNKSTSSTVTGMHVLMVPMLCMHFRISG